MIHSIRHLQRFFAVATRLILNERAALNGNQYLCDVRTIAWPLSRTLEMVSHSWRRATGSIPVVGSSRKTMGGSPTSATAVLNFRLLPPLHCGCKEDNIHESLFTGAQTLTKSKQSIWFVKQERKKEKLVKPWGIWGIFSFFLSVYLLFLFFFLVWLSL